MKWFTFSLSKGLSIEGLFNFCGIFPTHPTLAAARISPDPLQPDQAGKALYLTRSGRNRTPAQGYLQLFKKNSKFPLDNYSKSNIIVNVNRTPQPAFLSSYAAANMSY